MLPCTWHIGLERRHISKQLTSMGSYHPHVHFQDCHSTRRIFSVRSSVS